MYELYCLLHFIQLTHCFRNVCFIKNVTMNITSKNKIGNRYAT